jgi:DNA-binding response OmpR family regulator
MLIVGPEGRACAPTAGSADALLAAVQEHNAAALVLIGIDSIDSMDWACCVRSQPETADLPIVILRSFDELRRFETSPGRYTHLCNWLSQPVPSGKSELAGLHGTITVDQRGREIATAAGRATFSPTEFRLLLFLMRYAGVILSRTELLWRVSATSHTAEIRMVDVLVRSIRRKVSRVDGAEGLASRIQAVRRVGYTFLSGGVTLIDRLTGKPFPFCRCCPDADERPVALNTNRIGSPEANSGSAAIVNIY